MSNDSGTAATIDQNPPRDETEPQRLIAPLVDSDRPTSILPHHWKDLQGSGLSVETIQDAGIRSEVDHNKIALALNRKRWPRKYGPALIFPYRDLGGTTVLERVKADNPPADRNGKPKKYLQPSGVESRLYIPTRVREVASNPQIELLVTEGEKKSLKGTQEGFPTIGLAGVDCWHKRRSSALLPDLEQFKWKDRLVYVVFDSDLADNENVQVNEELLAAALGKRGAKVKVARLPDGPGGAKVGLDDFLVAHGPGTLRKLLDNAGDPVPPTPGTEKDEASAIDPATEAAVLLHSQEKDGLHRLRFWRGAFHSWQKGAYREKPNSEVRANIIWWLNQDYYNLGTSAVNNVLDQLKAQSILQASTEPPAWLKKGGGTKGWDPWTPTDILSTRTGLIHLPSLVAGTDYLLAPTPKFFTQTALDYGFNAEAPEPTIWLAFLDQLWSDQESIETLQEWYGYNLTVDTSQQKILMLVGPTRAGKGVISRVLRALVGPANVVGPTLASLATNFGLWPLLGKTAAIIADARLGGRTDSNIVVERLLSISGEDALTVDRKNQELVTGKLNTRIMILSNELPRLGDASGALAGRMILLQLTESFYGKEDRGLTDRLLAELPGILNWSILGWQRLRDRGHFVQPAAADDLLADLHDLGSPISEFLREKCLVGPTHNVPRPALYQAYTDWATELGRRHIEDDKGFGRHLRAALPALGRSQRRIDGQRTWFYEGVGLQDTNGEFWS